MTILGCLIIITLKIQFACCRDFNGLISIDIKEYISKTRRNDLFQLLVNDQFHYKKSLFYWKRIIKIYYLHAIAKRLLVAFFFQKCDLCNQYFCTKCLKFAFQNISKAKICSKCSILQSGKFSREDLEVYSVKELRQFLSRSKISLSNCCEKSDLVALVLKTTSFEANIEDLEHRRHVLHLKVNILYLLSQF